MSCLVKRYIRIIFIFMMYIVSTKPFVEKVFVVGKDFGISEFG